MRIRVSCGIGVRFGGRAFILRMRVGRLEGMFVSGRCWWIMGVVFGLGEWLWVFLECFLIRYSVVYVGADVSLRLLAAGASHMICWMEFTQLGNHVL